MAALFIMSLSESFHQHVAESQNKATIHFQAGAEMLYSAATDFSSLYMTPDAIVHERSIVMVVTSTENLPLYITAE